MAWTLCVKADTVFENFLLVDVLPAWLQGARPRGSGCPQAGPRHGALAHASGPLSGPRKQHQARSSSGPKTEWGFLLGAQLGLRPFLLLLLFGDGVPAQYPSQSYLLERQLVSGPTGSRLKDSCPRMNQTHVAPLPDSMLFRC